MKFRQFYLMHTNCPGSELVVTHKLLENLRFFTFMFSAIYFVFPGRKNSGNVAFYVHSQDGDEVLVPKPLGGLVEYNRESTDVECLEAGKTRYSVPLISSNGEYCGLLVFEQLKDRETLDHGDIFENILKLAAEDAKVSEVFFRSLVPDGIILFNRKGQAVFFSQMTTLILSRLNMKPEIIRRATFSELFHKLAERDDSVDISVCTLQTVNKKGFNISLLNLPVFHQEHCVGNILVISDVTSEMRFEKELQAKAPVIQEIHHRVKNNLQTITSLLRLQMRRDKAKPVTRALTKSINRIISIALIHEALSKEEMELVNIKESLRDLLQVIISNMVEQNKDIRGEIRGEDVFMTANQASNISLCVTEMVQNAIQHAFSYRSGGAIKITLEQNDQNVIITVEDNGNGISPASMRGGSLGLQIIRTITKESLGGTFSIESHRYGTLGRIVLPKSS
ncbi:MAG: sensor histidine kinase [Eubacteriales bacterium]